MLVTDKRFLFVIQILDEIGLLLDSYDSNCLQDRLTELDSVELRIVWNHVKGIEKILEQSA
jgi:hypothetical protein